MRSSLAIPHTTPLQKNSSKFVNDFLSYPASRQTNGQTNGQTNEHRVKWTGSNYSFVYHRRSAFIMKVKLVNWCLTALSAKTGYIVPLGVRNISRKTGENTSTS